jgi:predicted RNase H-like HicB family nuclease
MQYPVLIESEDGVYGVVFPDLPGCVAVGLSRDEALRNAEEAVRDWIECTEEAGEHVPAPSTPAAIDVPADCTLGSVTLVRSPSPNLTAIER